MYLTRIIAVSCTTSPTSSKFFTPPDELVDNVVRFTTLRDGEGANECGICFEPFGERGLAGRVRVVSTHCECTRENQVFHSVCLSRLFLEAPRQGGVRHVPCLYARHKLNAGELQPIIDQFFHASTDGGSSAAPHSAGSSSSSSDSHKSKGKKDSDDELLGYSPISSNGSMDSKTREVYEMTVHFGADRAEGQGNPYRFQWGKGREVINMGNEFGNRREPDGERNWKLDRIREIHAKFGETSDTESVSVMLDSDPSLDNEEISRLNGLNQPPEVSTYPQVDNREASGSPESFYTPEEQFPVEQ